MKKNENKISRKNYTLVFTIIAMTLVAATALFVIYNNQKEIEKDIPVLRGHSKEIELKDLDMYFTENQDFLLFVGASDDDISRKVEDDLIDVIDKNDLEIIYLNAKNIEDKQAFYDDFNTKYAFDKFLSNYPALLIIRDGKVLDLVQSDRKSVNAGDIIQLLELNELIGEDND